MKKRTLVATALLTGSFLVLGVPASQAATTKPKPKPLISSGSSRAGATQFKAFRNCLTKHGVVASTFGKPGSGTPVTQPKLDAKTQKAVAACASLRPKSGFASGFKVGGTEFAAFVSCMKDHKVTIHIPSFDPKPNPKAGSTSKARPSLAPSAGGQERGRGGILASLNQKDPKVAVALKICGALLPAQK